jgi:hypothetical protein
VWSPQVGESKGQENGQQNKYFKRKYLTFALKSFSIIEKKTGNTVKWYVVGLPWLVLRSNLCPKKTHSIAHVFFT